MSDESKTLRDEYERYERSCRELKKWRDNIITLAIFGEWGHETVDWMYFLGADPVLDRAQQLDGDDSREETDKVLYRFMDLVIDHLLAARKREWSPDDPLAVLLEHYFWDDVDKARIERAIARLDEAAKLAIRDLLAGEVA